MKKNILILIILVQGLAASAQFDPVPSFFRIQRELPFVNLNTTQTVLVSNYGAIVNDGVDDIAGITAAINAAVSLASLNNPVELVFDNGTYDLMPTSGTHALSMSDATGVLWNGQNAEFIVHNPAIGFLSLTRCTNTILKDFSVDYATLPFTQGIVTEVNPGAGFFIFQVDSGFPPPTAAHFQNASERWGMFKNSKGGIKEGTKNLISHNLFFELVGTNTYKYGNQSFNTLSKVEAGDYFVHIGRNNGRTIIRNSEGKNLTYMNITAYTSPAGGFNAFNSEEWNVLNCEIKLKGGRVHTTNADAMHVNGGKIGPWVEDSLFEGFADDFMNIKHFKVSLRQILGSNQIIVQGRAEIGDLIEFYNPRDGVYLGDATVINAIPQGGNQFELTLSNPVNLTIASSTGHQRADQGYIDNKCNESLILRNNVIRNSRRYGVLVQSKYALIENNTFQNLSGSAIRIENGADWGEGFRAKQIEIRNNVIENCGYDQTYIDEFNSAAISVDLAKVQNPCTEAMNFCGTESANWQGHSDIRIIDNTIFYNRRGLYLRNITNISVENNFMCHRDEDKTLEGTGNVPIEITHLNNTNFSLVEFNYELPSPNLQFILNESPDDTEIINSGTNQDVNLQISTNGGTIIQGFVDNEYGNTFNFDTEGNGSLRLINVTDGSPFPGPSGGSARTYSFWVKPEQSIFQTFLYSGGPLDGEVFVVQMLANGVLRVTDNNGNTVAMQDLPLDIGQWNHVAISVPENNTMFSVQLYKNGIPSQEFKTGEDALINTASTQLEFFPRFKGLGSDIRCFDSKLCSVEIEAIYLDRQILSDEGNNYPDGDLSIYPTLTSGKINFSKEVKEVMVIDVLGKTRLQKQESGLKAIDISLLPSGFYILHVNRVQTFKVFKK